jgi:hypothetical protein
VREADAFGAHHPLDHVAAFPARAFAVPHVLYRIDVQAGIFIFVEGTQADEFFAAALQFDSAGFRQPLDGDFALQPLLDPPGGTCGIGAPF